MRIIVIYSYTVRIDLRGVAAGIRVWLQEVVDLLAGLLVAAVEHRADWVAEYAVVLDRVIRWRVDLTMLQVGRVLLLLLLLIERVPVRVPYAG